MKPSHHPAGALVALAVLAAAASIVVHACRRVVAWAIGRFRACDWSAVGFASMCTAALLATLHLSTACSSLTATEGAVLEGLDVAACAGLSLIPVAGPALAAACVGEEGTVRDAVEHAVAAGVTTNGADSGANPAGSLVSPPTTKDAGPDASSTATSSRTTSPSAVVAALPLGTSRGPCTLLTAPSLAPLRLGAPLYAWRTDAAGHRVRRHIGRLPWGLSAEQVRAGQAWVDGQADGGSP